MKRCTAWTTCYNSSRMVDCQFVERRATQAAPKMSCVLGNCLDLLTWLYESGGCTVELLRTWAAGQETELQVADFQWQIFHPNK